MNNRLRLVLDTNILLVSISSKSAYHWIFEALLADEFDLCVTHDILLEYEEIIERKFNPLFLTLPVLAKRASVSAACVFRRQAQEYMTKRKRFLYDITRASTTVSH